jgi:low temperature requirement protein LtrA
VRCSSSSAARSAGPCSGCCGRRRASCGSHRSCAHRARSRSARRTSSIVAIGESVVAVGIGAAHLAVDARLVLVAALGLALSACLWWLYFGGDPERAEIALERFDPVRRAWAALRGFGWWHLPILLGIVMMAAAERQALTHPFAGASWADAAFLSAGVAIFLAGDVLFRLELGIGRLWVRAGAAALALAAMPLGVWSAAAHVGALVAVLTAAIALEASGR